MTRHLRRSRPIRLLAFATGLALAAGCSPQGDAPPAGDAAETTAAVADTGPKPAVVPPAGADALGLLTVRIDGKATSFETLPDRGRDRPPSAVVRAMGPVSQLQLQAHLPGDPMKQASLDATLMQRDGSYHPAGEPELHVFPEGMDGPGLLSTALEVEWDRLELGPDGGHVAGRFTGTVCLLRGATLTDEGCAPVEGEFDSQVLPAQF